MEVSTRTGGIRRGSSSPRRRPRGAATRRRRGAALVEFAIVAPLLFLFIFAVIEFGRMVMVHQIITNAAREGARRAILEQTTAAEAHTIVSDYLTASSISGATVSVTPADLDHVGFGDPITVKVSVPFDDVSWLPAPWFLVGTNLSVQSTMRAERPE